VRGFLYLNATFPLKGKTQHIVHAK